MSFPGFSLFGVFLLSLGENFPPFLLLFNANLNIYIYIVIVIVIVIVIFGRAGSLLLQVGCLHGEWRLFSSCDG